MTRTHTFSVMRTFAALACFLIATQAFASGPEDSRDSGERGHVRIAALAGSSGVGMAYLFSNKPNLGANMSVDFEIVPSADLLVPKLINGDIDIGVLPPNLAAKLYTVGRQPIVMGAVVGNGMLSVITRDPGIHGLADLAGKRVAVAGQGATPEFALRALLARQGISPTSIQIDFSIPVPEIAAALVSGKVDYAIVPEPFATVAITAGVSGDKPVRRAVLLRDSWESSGFGTNFPMTVCVIRADFARKNDATVRKFLDAYRASVAWTVAHPDEAGKLVETAGVGIKAPIAAKSIPFCGLTFESATEARKSVETLLGVFLEYSPEAIGNKLPDSGFYFK